MKLFEITINKNTFALIGKADISKRKTSFQAWINNVNIFENENYEKVRNILINIVNLNKEKSENFH